MRLSSRVSATSIFISTSRNTSSKSGSIHPIPAGAVRSEIRSNAAAAAGRCTIISPRSADWKSCCPMANSCARAWVRCLARRPGSSIATASAPMSTACSLSRISASSPKWVSGLLPEPEAYRDGTVSVPLHDDLIPFVETLAYLYNSQIVQGTTALDSPLLTYRVSKGGAVVDFPGDISVTELERVGREQNMPYWSVELHFYGPVKVVDLQWQYAKEKFGAIPGATFKEGRTYRFPVQLSDSDTVLRQGLGIPNLSVFGFLGKTQGHMDFSPIVPLSGEAVFEALKVLGDVYHSMGVPPQNQFISLPWAFFPRAFVFLFGFPIMHDVEFNKKNREVFRGLIKACADHGWGEYRTHIAYMDDVMNVYSFNEHALLRFHEKIKDALDPNGILSPGKQGIWPKNMRKARA